MTDPPSTEELLARILVSEDEAYPHAERRLLENTTADSLRTVAEGHDDPVAELVTHVAAWHEATPSVLDELDRYLDAAERWFRGKVTSTPPVHGIVQDLSARFGPSVADVLALRLNRMPNAPAWRTLTVLSFLERHPSRKATDAVIRFATSTKVPHLQQLAARALAASGDPTLARKLTAERQRLARTGRSLPGPLSSLTGVRA